MCELLLPLDAPTAQTRRHHLPSSLAAIEDYQARQGKLLDAVKSDLRALGVPLPRGFALMRQGGVIRWGRTLPAEAPSRRLFAAWQHENDRLRSLPPRSATGCSAAATGSIATGRASSPSGTRSSRGNTASASRRWRKTWMTRPCSMPLRAFGSTRRPRASVSSSPRRAPRRALSCSTVTRRTRPRHATYAEARRRRVRRWS